MAGLETLRLRVRDPEAQRAFYCSVLGMRDQGEGRVGYAASEVALRFEQAEAAYAPRATDLYWKIAISVPNIEQAVQQLEARGVVCTAPRQFEDVGYLAHFADPEGFAIELIDHHFQGDRPAQFDDPDRLGGGAHISLVTLRCADIAAVEPALLSWGMKVLSVQPVTSRGFTLHFYAATGEVPPDADVQAVENRTWVYQRPYTVLEIQHPQALTQETAPPAGAAGYAGLTVGGHVLGRLGICPD